MVEGGPSTRRGESILHTTVYEAHYEVLDSDPRRFGMAKVEGHFLLCLVSHAAVTWLPILSSRPGLESLCTAAEHQCFCRDFLRNTSPTSQVLTPTPRAGYLSTLKPNSIKPPLPSPSSLSHS